LVKKIYRNVSEALRNPIGVDDKALLLNLGIFFSPNRQQDEAPFTEHVAWVLSLASISECPGPICYSICGILWKCIFEYQFLRPWHFSIHLHKYKYFLWRYLL